ncbi:MAG: hypothetical protein WCR72_01635 [Bacteroidota bacterium]
MKTNTQVFQEMAIQKKQLQDHILSTIIEYSEEFENALIESLFRSIENKNEIGIEKDQIDSLHLLYRVLHDAKEFKSLYPENILINELINS